MYLVILLLLASGALLGDGIDSKISLSSWTSPSEFVSVRFISDGSNAFDVKAFINSEMKNGHR